MVIWFQKPFLRPPDRFRRVRDPNGTIWTTFGPPAGPARPALPGPENFFGLGSRGSRKKNFPKNFFVQKRYSLGPGWVLGPKKLGLDPSRPPKRCHFGPFYTQNGQNGIQKRPKTRIFEKIILLQNNISFSVPRWSGTLRNPKLAS